MQDDFDKIKILTNRFLSIEMELIINIYQNKGELYEKNSKYIDGVSNGSYNFVPKLCSSYGVFKLR